MAVRGLSDNSYGSAPYLILVYMLTYTSSNTQSDTSSLSHHKSHPSGGPEARGQHTFAETAHRSRRFVRWRFRGLCGRNSRVALSHPTQKSQSYTWGQDRSISFTLRCSRRCTNIMQARQVNMARIHVSDVGTYDVREDTPVGSQEQMVRVLRRWFRRGLSRTWQALYDTEASRCAK